MIWTLPVGLNLICADFPLANAAAELADHLRGRQPAGLDVGREADAAQLAARLGLGAARLEALVVGELHRLVDYQAGSCPSRTQRHRRLDTGRRLSGIEFFWRSSAGSIFISAAAWLTMLSITKVASGRPAPR